MNTGKVSAWHKKMIYSSKQPHEIANIIMKSAEKETEA